MVSRATECVEGEKRLAPSKGREVDQCGVAAVTKLAKKYEEGRQAPLLFVKVKNERKKLVAMIDTGAAVNVIGRELAHVMEGEKLEACPLNLCGCGGQSRSSSWVKAPLEFSNGLKVSIEAVVGEEFGTALILGAPFLHGNKVGIEYDGCYLKTSLGNVPCVMVPELMRSNSTVSAGAVAVSTMSDEDSQVLESIVEKARATPEEKERLKALLLEFGDLWMGNPRGETSVLRHKIRLTTDVPVREKPRRFTPEQLKVIDSEVEKMLNAGVIRPSCSPYAQEPHLVRKKTQDWRFCVDFRRLNQITVADEWPMPRIQDLVRSIRDSSHFVGLDLRAGYWQIPMQEESIKYTAFRTRSGLYEFKVMPFGLKTAPATFNRLMDRVVGDLFWSGVCVYLDDVLVHSKSFEGTLLLLREVFERLRGAKLTLAMNKCMFLPERLIYLGFEIKEGVLRPNMDRVEALRRIRTPANASAVRSLLGCLGYFRQFIPDYAKTAEPLNRLLRKKTVFVWTLECEEAKEKLINALVEATLSNPLEGDQLKLETDASATAIGGALYCRAKEEDPWRPIEFLSKNLNPTQRNWPAHEREAYAIVHSLNKLDAFLRGKKFDVFTDNASLQWMQTSKAGKIARWAGVLGEYDMRIVYRPGRTNVCADFLSRFIDNTGDEEIPDRAFFNAIQTTAAIPTIEAIIAAQKTQPPPKARGYYRKEGVVYHRNKVWVPPAQRLSLIEAFHNIIMFHHPGVRRMATAIRKMFSWAGLYADIMRYNKSCLGCQRLRPGTEALQGLLTSHPVDGPFCRVYMDIYIVEINGENQLILSIIDGHTRWVESRVIPNRSAATVATVFMQEWVCRFGCPLELIVDHERAFVSEFMQIVCKMLGTRRLPTTVGHPDANAPIESFHRVLTKGFQRYLVAGKRTLPVEEILQLILLGYRASYHSVVKETPAYLTLGMDPRLGSGMLGNRCMPENQQRIEILNAVREDVVHKAYIRGIQQFEKNQQYRRTEPLTVGELVLLPIERSGAGYHAMKSGGAKVQPKYSMPYRVVRVFNEGRSAICKNLCVVSTRCSMFREVSIQDLRRIAPPLTDWQRQEWAAVLDNYYEVKRKLAHAFWEEVNTPPESIERERKRTM